MKGSTLHFVLLFLAPALAWCVSAAAGDPLRHGRFTLDEEDPQVPAMQIRFLEIVTPDLDETCATLAEVHGVTFGDPVAELGNARTAQLATGGRISVRAPMHASEESVARPYFLVDDIQSAFEAVQAAGVEVMHPPLEIPGQGTFAIYRQGGIQYGLWQD